MASETTVFGIPAASFWPLVTGVASIASVKLFEYVLSGRRLLARGDKKEARDGERADNTSAVDGYDKLTQRLNDEIQRLTTELGKATGETETEKAKRRAAETLIDERDGVIKALKADGVAKDRLIERLDTECKAALRGQANVEGGVTSLRQQLMETQQKLTDALSVAQSAPRGE